MILEVSGTVQLHSTRDPNQRAVPQTAALSRRPPDTGGRCPRATVVLSDLHKERLNRAGGDGPPQRL